MPVTINGTSGVTTPAIDAAAGNADLTTLSVAGNEISAVNSLGFRNRIINGDMRIDQRNAGAASSTTTGYFFSVDRFQTAANGGGAITMQQSSTVPSGTNFRYSLKALVSTADASIAAGDEYVLYQPIEGYNIADMGFGTASASAVTLSFWVRSSVTGTYSVALYTSTRSYIATYTVNAADTFEYKTVSLVADTSGTYNTTNGAGTIVGFDLGSGSNYNGTANTWQSGTYLHRTSGSVNWIATSGATFYITGVQLEAGSVATPFERRDYGRELIMCQRYFQTNYNLGTAVGSISGSGPAIARASASTQTYLVELQRFMQVSMRATPTVTAYSSNTGASGKVHVSGSDVTVTSMNDQGTYSFGYPLIASTPSAGNDCRCFYVASAEL